MVTDQKWSRASLRISSRRLTCADITRVLDIAPTKCFEKGTAIGPERRTGAMRDETLWILESGLSVEEPLEGHIQDILSLVQGNEARFGELLPDCQLEIFCGFASASGQGGLVLSSALLKAITVAPIDLVIDLYPPGADV